MGLRTRFLISLVLITATLTTAALWIVRQNVRVHVREELATALDNSAVTFSEVQRRREADAQRTAQLIADVPVLKAVMTTHDAATIQDASTDLWRLAGTDLLAVADSSGRVVALHAAKPAPERQAIEQLFERSLSPYRPTDWWYAGQLYQVFLQPVYAGDPSQRTSLGVVAIGYAIDDTLAAEVARIAAGPVAFRYDQRIIVSTLDAERQKELQERIQGGAESPGAREFRLDGETFLAAPMKLANNSKTPVQLIMLKSYDRATVFLTRLNLLVMVVGGAAVLVGALLVSFISHRFTRPLAELLTGVRALAKGDFTYPLQPSKRHHDEVAELTQAFDSMRRNLHESQARMVNAARMEAVGQLAGGVAHDFNNFVTIIKGYSDLLVLQVPEGDPIAGYVEQIKKAGDRAASVTRQLLAFSRKQVFQPQLIDLNALAANLSKMLRVLIGEDIEVKITSEAGLPKVLADPGQIEQVLVNLAVNARDAMPNGGRLLIETTTSEMPESTWNADKAGTGRFLKLSVQDTGCGMSEELQKQIFTPFFTTKETGKGTGLGLSIVEGIVRKNGGFIRVQSQVGRGTTFSIFLPEAAQAVAVRAPEAQGLRMVRAASGTVLLVEDEEALRALARETLKLGGYTVIDAENGLDALAKLEQAGSVDLVLSDVVMPRMGGIELAKKLRSDSPGVRILLMSGYSDRVQELEDNDLPLLQKPFTPEQLLRTIGSELEEVAAVAAE